jgi:hypothetical protein
MCDYRRPYVRRRRAPDRYTNHNMTDQSIWLPDAPVAGRQTGPMTTEDSRWERYVRACLPDFAALVAIALRDRAAWAGVQVAAGAAHGVSQQEETLTESMLLELCRTLPDLRVATYNRAKERRTGADWEWWVQGRTDWFGYLIQAKKSSGTLAVHSSYRLGATSGSAKDSQSRLLLEEAKRRSLPAVHVLYNPADATTVDPFPYASTSCKQVRDGLLPSGSDGVTVLSSLVADWLVPFQPTAIPLAEVRPYAVPWSCLASCPARCGLRRARGVKVSPQQLGFSDEIESDDPAYRAAVQVLVLGRAASGAQFFNQLRADVVDPAFASVRQGVRRTPPPYLPPRNANENLPGGVQANFSEPSDDQETLPRHVVVQYLPQGS